MATKDTGKSTDYTYAPPLGLLKRTKDYMRIVVDKLKEMDKLEAVDMATLDLLASSYDRYLRAEAIIRKEGFTIVGGRGLMTTHPAVKMSKDASTQVFHLARELGLTVKSREQMPTLKSTDEEDDPLKGLLKGDK